MFDEDAEYCDECASYGCPGHEICPKCDGDICNECDGCDCPDSPCPGYYNHY
ncbi:MULTISPECIES: hypothetical protein [unclassified Streptomyces]|uniref:hypothetical protein n=1 Tax=unclassified Streptomyces TaxID=2593676 RepID=UPI00037FEFEF|nr:MULTISPECIES: hypothetical protein [unclassified Streptomyces]QKW28348.1 hypothetical protein HUT11_21215 [Streptomyces seoulensis]